MISHLWLHQTLWLRLRALGGGAPDRYVAVPLSELLELSAAPGAHYAKSVALEEEVLDGTGVVELSIELQGHGPELSAASRPRPSAGAAFTLVLELAEGSAALAARALGSARAGHRGLHLRC